MSFFFFHGKVASLKLIQSLVSITCNLMLYSVGLEDNICCIFLCPTIYMKKTFCLFVLKNCCQSLFAKIISTHLTFFSVNVKVYFAKFSQKFVIHKSLFFKFCEFFSSRKFLPAKVFALKVLRLMS